jgi:hypothetical protein
MLEEKDIAGHTMVESKRKRAIHKAFEKYTVSEFKCWTIDTLGELIQQVTRLRTDRCDKEELIKNALMAEDAVCMLWMLMKSDAELIHQIKDKVYSDFEREMAEERPMGDL